MTTRLRFLVLALGTLVLACGCGGETSCTTTPDCPLDYACVSGVCERNAVLPDAGVDAAEMDAAVPDPDVDAGETDADETDAEGAPDSDDDAA